VRGRKRVKSIEEAQVAYVEKMERKAAREGGRRDLPPTRLDKYIYIMNSASLLGISSWIVGLMLFGACFRIVAERWSWPVWITTFAVLASIYVATASYFGWAILRPRRLFSLRCLVLASIQALIVSLSALLITKGVLPAPHLFRLRPPGMKGRDGMSLEWVIVLVLSAATVVVLDLLAPWIDRHAGGSRDD
jgi:hypothetical protein